VARFPRTVPWEALALFLVAFALRAAYAWVAQGPAAVPSSDGISYDEIALNLARGIGFKMSGAAGLYPTAFRPPVLPWLVSLVYRVGGHWYFGGLLLQCAIGALVPHALGALARQTWGSGVARIAAWLAAVHPLLVFFSGYLLTETTFTLAMLLALTASVAWVKAPRRGRAVGAGLLWGIAILTRPNALAMPFLVAAWAFFPLGLTTNGRERLRLYALLALGVALAVGPWTLRNARELHAFVPVTTGGGRALLDANNELIWSDPALRGGAMSVYNLPPYAARLHGLSEPAADALSGSMAKDFLRAHAAEWPAMAGAKLARFWRLTSEGGPLTGRWHGAGNRSPLDALRGLLDPLLLWSVVVLPFALAGIVIAMRSAKRWFLALPLLTIALFTASAAVYWGALRMRVPIEPLILLYAAVAVDALLKRWRVQRSGLRLVERG
jgi:4-amino-4-deoxy-L-arabinose transferase-like glycosyltransferase